jgi:hypothetical protein
MISTVSHILPLAKIRRQRMLPLPGTVLVRAGQSVQATDIIAQANLRPEHQVLDVARGLGVSHNETVKYIKRSIGDQVEAGGVIADKGGFARVIRAPSSGKIVAISGGQVLLEINSHPYQLFAGISGKVLQVETDYGAVIESSGSWIQGIWGNDQIAVGSLMVLAEDPEHNLTASECHADQRGSVIFAGHCCEHGVFELGIANQWCALILGSMASFLVPAARKTPYPIIVLDGFGEIPVNPVAHKLLSTSAQREVVVNSISYSLNTGERPEITIPMEAVSSPIPVDLQRLSEGQQVKLLHTPWIGTVGTIQSLVPGLTRFPNGVQAPGVRIDFENGDNMVVPVANIEVLG